MNDIAFFLPTRRGSQRVQRKNTKPFGDFEGGLLELKIKQLLEVKGVKTIILSTNDPESIGIARQFRGHEKEILVIERPDELASHTTLVEDFIKYIPTIVSHTHIFWTHVTAPFVKASIYEEAIARYFEVIQGEHDSMLSVTKFQQFLWSDKTRDIINCDRSVNKWPNTQDLDPLYEINHAFYISSRENYLKYNDRIGKHPYLFELNKIDAVDIDTEEDFKIAEAIYEVGGIIPKNNVKKKSRHIDPKGPYTCFLPCRKGSQRVKNKNIRPFAEFEYGLLELKLKQLLKVSEFDTIILSTNDEEIIDYADGIQDSRLKIDVRRDELCQSETSTDELIKYVPEIIQEGHVLWTHVTSPFINEAEYLSAIQLYKQHLAQGYDSLMSVSKIQKFMFEEEANAVNFDRDKEKWPRTQTITPYYESNSAYFISHISNYTELADRIGNRVYMAEVDKLKSFDIDWEEDFLIAEAIYHQIFKPKYDIEPGI